MKRRPLVGTVERPDGDKVDLKTVARGFRADYSGNMHVAITEDFLDEYTAPDGERRSVVKARTIDIAFTSDARHLLVFAGKMLAGPIAAKVSELAFGTKADSILGRSIPADQIDAFITSHSAQIMSCSWKELQIPSLSGAHLNGSEIGGSSDFMRFDRHGSKSSVRLRLPALGMTLSMNREASVHFYTSHELLEQIEFIKQHVVPLCR